MFPISNPSQGAEDDAVQDDIVRLERYVRLKPKESKIVDINFWDKDHENSWFIAINYLDMMHKKIGSLDPLKDKDFLKCAGASFLRINYRLVNNSDPQSQARLIREFEPDIAELLSKGLFSIEALWLENLPEVSLTFTSDGKVKTKNPESPPRFLTKLPSSYQGTHLLIGGERDGQNLHQDKFIINIDKTYQPDMLADGVVGYTFMIFPDNKFEEISYNHIDHAILTGETNGDTLQELCRILKVGGGLKFKTEHGYKNYFLDLLKSKAIMATIRSKLTEKGFSIQKLSLVKDIRSEWEHAPYYINVEATKE